MDGFARSCIAELDAALLEYGETVRLHRLTEGPGGIQIPFEAVCPAKVTALQPQDLVIGGVPDSEVIISPTALAAAQWPMPPRKDDRIFIQDVAANIESVKVIKVAGEVVRIELSCRS